MNEGEFGDVYEPGKFSFTIPFDKLAQKDRNFINKKIGKIYKNKMTILDINEKQ